VVVDKVVKTAVTARIKICAGLCWSFDSFQLAALDASSNLKAWWMRPEEREDGKEVLPCALVLPA
jgi:hypothetical protein